MRTFPWGTLPPIRIHNSLTRRDEVFPSCDEHPEVSIYVCGPTTYAFVHIGNMRNPVFYDVVRRIFKSHGYRVKFVTNFTDIDDKMIDEAKRVGESDPIQLSARFVHEYYTDLFALGVEKADYYPKVSTHITDIIDYIKLIMSNGHGYVGSDGSVYFDVKSYPDYLKLSGMKMDDLLDESRQDEKAEAKRDSRDFALWKAAKPGEPEWPFSQTDDEIAKFGRISGGRPGWHIECSVMSAKYLGPTFDIHGGGKELKFPHHENEIAQAKCGHPDEDFAKIWMHNEWVVLPSGEKMAKSGESILIRDVLKQHDPDTVRMFILSGHYRKEVEYSPERLDDQAKAKARLVETFKRLKDFLNYRAEEREENWLQIWRQVDRAYEQEPGSISALRAIKNLQDGLRIGNIYSIQPASAYLVEAVREALFHAYRHFSDDFDTQGAIGELFTLIRRVNLSLDRMSKGNVYDFDAANIALGAVVHLTGILGILKKQREGLYLPPDEWEKMDKASGDTAKLTDVILAIREDVKSNAKDMEIQHQFDIAKVFLEESNKLHEFLNSNVWLDALNLFTHKESELKKQTALALQKLQNDLKEIAGKKDAERLNQIIETYSDRESALQKQTALVFQELQNDLKEIGGDIDVERLNQFIETYSNRESELQKQTALVLQELQNDLKEIASKIDVKRLNQFIETYSKSQYLLADKIRNKLHEIGAEVRDSKDGPKIVWK